MAAEGFPVARIDEYTKPCEPAIHVLRSVGTIPSRHARPSKWRRSQMFTQWSERDTILPFNYLDFCVLFIPGNCQATIQTNNNDGSSPPSYSQFTWYAQEYNEPKTWQFTFYVQAGHSAYVKLAEYTELSSRQPAFEIGM